MINQTYWRAEVYTNSEVELGKAVIRKLYAGLYDSRAKAEEAAQRKCRRVKGFGFYVHKAADIFADPRQKHAGMTIS